MSEPVAPGEARLRALLAGVRDYAIVMLDAAGRVASWNEGAARITGYAEAEILGQFLGRFWEADEVDREQPERALRVAADSGRFAAQGWRVRRDGQRFWAEVVITRLPAAPHEPAAFALVMRDVTERRLAEDVLRASEERFRNVVELAPDGIVIVDAEGRIVLANGEAHRMFGYGPGELLDQPVERLVPDAARAQHADHRAAYGLSPRTRPMGAGLELAGRRQDGREFPVEISLSPLESGGETLVTAVVRDISERKEMEARLRALHEDLERRALEQAARRADRLAALGTLATGLAHELNNPIGILSSRIELMLLEAESSGLPAGVREDLAVLHRQAQRVARIAQGLLSFARQAPGERTPVDLNDVVRETLLLAEGQIARAGIEVDVRLAPALPPVVGDAGALQQVVLNLVTNAWDAVDGHGTIRIATAVVGPPSAVQLSVADTGRGIAPEDLPRIFDPFFTTKATGTGLGLSISHGIVQDHGGTIDVQSSAGGTRVVLSFPAAPA